MLDKSNLLEVVVCDGATVFNRVFLSCRGEELSEKKTQKTMFIRVLGNHPKKEEGYLAIFCNL